MTVRRLQQPRGWAFSLAVPILKPLMLAITKRTWEGGENVPATGGCILVFNHISHADPLTAAHFVYDHGRIPRYLAKSGLFKNKALGLFLRGAGQIPVERLSRNAKGAYDAAVAAVRAAGGRVTSRGEFVPGEPYVFFQDPDGYEVEIWYEWPTAFDPGRKRR